MDYRPPGSSREFFRQEYWSGLPFPFPGDLPHPGIKPRSPTIQADPLPSEPPGCRRRRPSSLDDGGNLGVVVERRPQCAVSHFCGYWFIQIYYFLPEYIFVIYICLEQYFSWDFRFIGITLCLLFLMNHMDPKLYFFWLS